MEKENVMCERYSGGLLNQVGDGFENADYTPAELTKLRSSPQLLRDLKLVLGGQAQIIVMKHLIDMDAPSKRAPKNWEVREEDQLPNRVCGKLEWDPTKSSLFLSEEQKGDKYLQGYTLRKELEDYQVYSDNLLDFYLDHPEAPTPEEWKGKWVFFWGRIYRGADCSLIVRCLDRDQGGSRYSDYGYLGYDFSCYDPSLVVGK